MKYEFQIVTAQDSDNLLRRIEDRLKWIKQKNYSFSTHTSTNSEHGFCVISLQLEGNKCDSVFRDEDIIYIYKHQVSEVLAEHIVCDWTSKLIWKNILRTCRQLSAEDKENIYQKASEFLSKCHSNESLNLLVNFGRKNRMAHRLFEHLETNENLAVEGFIQFCLPEYLSEIRFAVELAREELKSEKEYNEFVKLLRYFVDTQVPRVYEVNLVMGENGVFYLWDQDGTKIEEKYINYYLDDMLLNEISLDDVLISILVTIAPRRIVLHNTENLSASEPVKMIKNVFQEKIVVCSGCEHCLAYRKENKYKS